MSIQLATTNGGLGLEVKAHGKIAHEDYGHFVPVFDKQVLEHGKVNVLFDMEDFHGWTARALWDDIKFDFRHYTNIGRLALVGDRRWEKAMSVFCRPFTAAWVRYFDRNRIDEARAWLAADDYARTHH